jgi:hypothetical protein
MGRIIVLLSDGTGNSAAKVWRTNVWRVTIRIVIGLIQGIIRAHSEAELDRKARAAYRDFRRRNFHTIWRTKPRAMGIKMGMMSKPAYLAIRDSTGTRSSNIPILGSKQSNGFPEPGLFAFFSKQARCAETAPPNTESQLATASVGLAANLWPFVYLRAHVCPHSRDYRSASQLSFANSWRTPPSRPRASARSRACVLRPP